MFGMDQQETAVLVLRDAEEIGDAVQRAPATAGPDERPGPERAAAIIADERARTDEGLRECRLWDVLGGSGIDPRTDYVAGVAALRNAVPGLSPAAAGRLVRESAGKA
ncbi:hypothetical protein ABZW18_25845 [Streptomyces sp. NPDC004647]|uniref:hypothetical protein n=1 Tax=Streptomyces sp. NPDC004647 TaxID=3154671 RepID=UPI0033B64894